MAQPKKTVDDGINVIQVTRETFTACVIGTTPIVFNRLAQKAQRELLYPSTRTKESKKKDKSNFKHNPMEEYRLSPYLDQSGDGPTLVQGLGVWFKKAMASVALDLPDTDTSKAQLNRLLTAPEDRVPIWGIPQMHITYTRCSDIKRTPDMRTRMIIPRWASEVTIAWTRPIVSREIAIRLLAAAGIMNGVGEWRTQKGGGDYGSFEIVEPDDKRFLAIKKAGGREVQVAALESPGFYDSDTAELYNWFVAEVQRRAAGDEFNAAAGSDGKKNGKSKRKVNQAQVNA